MEIKEQLKEMFQMQRTLNKSILDEFGELTHELKGDWCWWKKSQVPVNRKRVLEELVDVYHFVMTSEMMHSYLSNKDIIDIILIKYECSINHFNEPEKERLDYLIGDISAGYDKLAVLLQLTKCLQFSFDDVYQEYLNKNKINYERLKNGY